MTRANNRRSMVSGGEEIPHKCAGTESSQIGNNYFYYNKDEGNFHPARMDNIVALSNLMKMGGESQELVTISKEILDYLLLHQITIINNYLPGVLNVEPDRESRI